MKKVVTVIVVLVALTAFSGPGVAQQKPQTSTQQQKSQTVPKQTPVGSINLNSSRSNREAAPPAAAPGTQPTQKPAGRAAACSGGCPGCPKGQCAQGPNGDCVCMGSAE